MKAVIAIVLCVAAATNAGLLAAPALLSAPTVIARAPSLDSAIIKSDRIGGNFAYSVAEGHAYTATSPIIQQVATPVAVSYSAPAITHINTIAAPAVYSAPLLKTVAAPAVLSAPVLKTVAAPAVLSASVLKTVAAPAVLAAPATIIKGTPAATVKIA